MLDATQTIQIFQRQPDPLTFGAGQVIFQEGQSSNLMYGLIDGEVEVIVDHQVVELIRQGGIFGIGAMIDINQRPYTAIAKTDCKLAYLDKQRFLFAIQETPLFAIGVMRSYSDRLKQLHSLPIR